MKKYKDDYDKFEEFWDQEMRKNDPLEEER